MASKRHPEDLGNMPRELADHDPHGGGRVDGTGRRQTNDQAQRTGKVTATRLARLQSALADSQYYSRVNLRR